MNAPNWLTRNIAALGFVSLLSDLSHAMVIAITDSLERSITADVLPSHMRGTGF